MKSFLHSVAHFVQGSLESHFLLIWLSCLLLVLLLGLWVTARGSPNFSVGSEKGASGGQGTFRRQLCVKDGVAAILFLVFASLYVFMIYYKEDFAYYDDEMLTDFSVSGTSMHPPVWPGAGRFFPLADQEFNLLRFVTRSAFGYHSLVVVQLILLLAVLFFVLLEFPVRYRFLILAAAMLAPSFVIPFSGFVYPERNLLFWLAILLLCLQGYSRTRARIYFLGCLVATQFVLYYKETAVLFVVAYAVTRILLQLGDARRAGLRSWRQLARENSLSIGILVVSSIYVLLFLGAMLPHRGSSYISQGRQPLSSVLWAYFQFDWLPLILLPVLLVRFARFIFFRGRLDPLWDSLGVGALAYYLAIIALGLISGYYMAPVDLFALLYLASLALVWLSKPTPARVSAVAIVLACVLLQDVAYSWFRMVERKSVISTKHQLADFLTGYLPGLKTDTVEIFFPYSNGYDLMEMSSYLKYKGFRLAGQSALDSQAEPRLVIEGREEFPDNHCVVYRDYVCIHAESAKTGALIIILPEDSVSNRDVQLIAGDSTPLLSLNEPELGFRNGSRFGILHAIVPKFSASPLPEHWLCLDVFKKVTDDPRFQDHSSPASQVEMRNDSLM